VIDNRWCRSLYMPQRAPTPACGACYTDTQASINGKTNRPTGLVFFHALSTSGPNGNQLLHRISMFKSGHNDPASPVSPPALPTPARRLRRRNRDLRLFPFDLRLTRSFNTKVTLHHGALCTQFRSKSGMDVPTAENHFPSRPPSSTGRRRSAVVASTFPTQGLLQPSRR